MTLLAVVWGHEPFGFCFCVLIAWPCVTIQRGQQTVWSSTVPQDISGRMRFKITLYITKWYKCLYVYMCDACVCLRMDVCECARAFVTVFAVWLFESLCWVSRVYMNTCVERVPARETQFVSLTPYSHINTHLLTRHSHTHTHTRQHLGHTGTKLAGTAFGSTDPRLLVVSSHTHIHPSNSQCERLLRHQKEREGRVARFGVALCL